MGFFDKAMKPITDWKKHRAEEERADERLHEALRCVALDYQRQGATILQEYCGVAGRVANLVMVIGGVTFHKSIFSVSDSEQIERIKRCYSEYENLEDIEIVAHDVSGIEVPRYTRYRCQSIDSKSAFEEDFYIEHGVPRIHEDNILIVEQ